MSVYGLLYAPLQRFYTFILKKLIGDYLKDELHQSQLEVELRNGKLELKDLELNVEMLNEAVSGLPFKFVEGRVRKIQAIIPWHSLSRENCKITLQGLVLYIEPLDEQDFPDNPLSRSILMEASIAALNEEMGPLVKHHLKQTLGRGSNASQKSEKSVEEENDKETAAAHGLSVVGNMLETVVAETEVFIEDLSLRMQHLDASRQKISAVVLRVPHAKYLNIGGWDKEKKESAKGEHKETVDSEPHDLESSEIEAKRYKKEIRFRGLRVDLIEDVQGGPNNTGTNPVTIAHGDIDHDTIMSLLLSIDQKTHSVDCSCAVRALRLLCSPQQFEHLCTAANDLGKSSQILMEMHHRLKEEASTILGDDQDDKSTKRKLTRQKSVDIDSLFADAKSSLINKARGDKKQALGTISRPMKTEDYNTVEALLHQYKQPTANTMTESFASIESDTSDQFFDCNSGSMAALNPMSASVMNPSQKKEQCEEGKVNTAGSDNATQMIESKTTTPVAKVWNLTLTVERLCIILLEENVNGDRWPSDTDWYLSPIPLSSSSDDGEENMAAHPAPAVCEFGIEHIVGNLDGISISLEQSPFQFRSKSSVSTAELFEYIHKKDTGLNERKNRWRSPSSYTCTRVVGFGIKNGASPKKSPDMKGNDEKKQTPPPTIVREGCDSSADEEKEEENEVEEIPDMESYFDNDEPLVDDGLEVEVFGDSPVIHPEEPELSDVEEKTGVEDQKEEKYSNLEARVGKILTTMNKQLNPDLVIYTRTVLDCQDRASIRSGMPMKATTEINVNTQKVVVELSMSTLQRMQAFMECFSHSTRPESEQKVTPGAQEEDKFQEQTISPSSSQESLDFYSDIVPQQIRMGDLHKQQTRKRHRGDQREQETSINIDIPQIQIKFAVPSNPSDWVPGQPCRGLMIKINRLHAANCEIAEGNNGARRAVEGRDDDDTWSVQASSITLYHTSGDSKSEGEGSNGGKRIITISREKNSVPKQLPRLVIVKRCMHADMFYPILAGKGYTTERTEAFFQGLSTGGSLRVWETAESASEAAKEWKAKEEGSGGSAKQKKSPKEWEQSSEQLSQTAVYVNVPNISLCVNRNEYVQVLELLGDVATSLGGGKEKLDDDEKNQNTDGKKNNVEREATVNIPLPDPSLLPEHPDHVPPPPSNPKFNVKISKNRIHTAYRHKMAFSFSVGTFHARIIDKLPVQAQMAGVAAGIPYSALSNSEGFDLTLKEFRMFHLVQFNQQDMSYTSFSSRHAELLEANFDPGGRRRAMPIFFNTLQGGEDDIIHISHVVSKTQNQKQMQTVLNLKSVTLQLNLSSSWASRMGAFFSLPRTESKEPDASGAISNFYVHAYDCAIDYNSPVIDARAVLVFDRISVRSCAGENDRSSSHITLDLRDLRGYLVPKSPKPRLHPRPLRLSRMNIGVKKPYGHEEVPLRHLYGIYGETLVEHLETHGFLRVLDINEFGLQVHIVDKSMHTGRPESVSELLLPDTMVELTNGLLNVYACADSFSVLIGVTQQFGTEITHVEDLPEVQISFHHDNKTVESKHNSRPKSSSAKSLEIKHTPSLESNNNSKQGVEEPKSVVNLLGGIDMDAFSLGTEGAKETKHAMTTQGTQPLLPSISIIDNYSPAIASDDKNVHRDVKANVANSRDTKERKTGGEQQARWMGSPPDVTEGYFKVPNEDDGIYRAKNLQPPGSHPRPGFTFKMHSVSARLRLFGGRDFSSPTQSQSCGEEKKGAGEMESKGISIEKKNIGPTMSTINDSDSKHSVLKGKQNMSDYNSMVGTTTPASDDFKSVCSTVSSMSSRPVGSDAMRTVDIPPFAATKGLDAFVVERCKDEERGGAGRWRGKRKRKNKGTRSTRKMIELNLKGIHMVMNNYEEASQVASYLALAVDDIEAIDGIQSSMFRKLLCYDRQRDNIRESGSSMIHFALSNVRPDREAPDRQEARLRVALLPLRLNIDQDTVEFLITLFGNVSVPKASQVVENPSSCDKPKENEEQTEERKDNSSHVPKNGAGAGAEVYIQWFSVKECQICIDYKPKRIDLHSLRNGDYAQLVHLFPLEGVGITLEPKRFVGIEGWGRLGLQLGKEWAGQILAHQTHRYLSGIQPLRSIVKVGTGVVDLVMIPVEQFKRDGRLLRGLRLGTFSFLKNLTMETINVTTSLAVGAQSLLESMDSAMTAAGSGKPRRGGSRRTKRATAGGKRMPWRRNKMAGQPSGYDEGLRQAYEALSRGLQSAAHKIIFVPTEQLRTGEYKSALKSAISAVPSAVLRPMIGATEAVSKTLLGIKNTVDPKGRAESNDKFKE